MSQPIQLEVKEPLSELRKLLKTAPTMIIPRLRLLLFYKEHPNQGFSKRELAAHLGVSPDRVHIWRNQYREKGISVLLTHNKGGYRPSAISSEEHEKLEELLHTPDNGIQGYTELQRWFEETFKRTIPYTTLVGYCKRHFQTKIKVARKSHDKKDEQAVKAFKKTFIGSSKNM